MKALFANKAKSMLRKCAPQTTKDPASTTCRVWQMMKTGSSGGAIQQRNAAGIG